MPGSAKSFKRLKIILPLCLAAAFISCSGAGHVVIEPVEIDDTLLNPGRGFATTHIFNDGIQGRRHPKCTVVQFRWYWDELEPEEGRINFALIDETLARARANGQKLNFRVMCQNGVAKTPRWLKEAGVKWEPYTNDPDNWQPRYDDPVFLEKHRTLISALGERYDGHPDLDCVDIGTVGRWGEWHTSGTGMEMPSREVRKEIIDMYLDSFRKTPLIMLIGGESGLAYAIARGAGWRADCLGDMGGFNDNWNHMEHFYQQALDDAGAKEAWKHAPVIFETCWTMEFWHEKGWDLDYILSEALRWHVSVLNNGSESIPEEWWPEVVEFEKKMGYRFVLKKFTHLSKVKQGGTFFYEMEWENKGVAPCYLNYPLAFELKARGDGGQAWVVEAGVNITGWLPGTIPLQASLALPAEIPPGKYDLGVGMLDPHTGKPGIKFAIQGLDPDGWYRLSEIEVR